MIRTNRYLNMSSTSNTGHKATNHKNKICMVLAVLGCNVSTSLRDVHLCDFVCIVIPYFLC